MKYYVGAIDPAGGPYCAPARGPRRTLELGDTKHLVGLAPSQVLFDRYQACLAIRNALAANELPDRTRHSLKAWANTSARKHQTQMILDLLHGRTLEEAENLFTEAYTRELTGPQAWAALAWLAFDPEAELIGDIEIVGAIIRNAIDSPIGPLRGSSHSG